MLKQYAKRYGYELEIVEKAVYRKREISSTYIREALKVGNVELAEKLLGYRYRTEGVVEHGQKLGRTLGFPTLNVAWKPEKAAPPVWRICMQSKNGWNLVLRNRQSGDQTDGNGCKTDFDRGVCI